MPWPKNFAQPTVTIIMPTQRHRGLIVQAIESWAAQQYPLDKLDFIFVSNGREPQIDAQVTARLAQGDVPRGGVVFIKTENEMAQYSYATRFARGEWLLFTEPHCLASPDCVPELIGNLLERNMVGGCVRTLPDGVAHRHAQIESRVYFDDFATWSQPDDWRKFTKRGFALRRDVFRSIGGIADDYGWFSELIIAARLAADGRATGYVPTATVQHFNSTRIGELFDYVWHYRREMARYMDVGDEVLKPYFNSFCAGRAVEPPFVEQASRKAQRAALVDALGRLHTFRGMRLARAMLATMMEQAGGPMLKFGPRYWLARARLAWLSFSLDAAYRNYQEATSTLGEWAEADYTPLAAEPAACGNLSANGLAIHPGELTAGLFGFHASERYGGRRFRWTSPVASLIIEAAPGDYECVLDYGDIACAEPPLAFWNGQRLRVVDGNTLQIPAHAFAAQPWQVLTLITAPRRSTDARESRQLGAALFAVRLKSSTATPMAKPKQRAA